jgi:hypothetical protein
MESLYNESSHTVSDGQLNTSTNSAAVHGLNMVIRQLGSSCGRDKHSIAGNVLQFKVGTTGNVVTMKLESTKNVISEHLNIRI